MKKLANQVIKEYKEALLVDAENTDALFFILDEIGSENGLDDQQFETLSQYVNSII